MAEVLQVRGLRRSFESEGTPVRALRGVDLAVARGELVAVMGPSGCGKSTLLNLVAGLDTPSAGEVVVDGEPLNGRDENELALMRRRHIGFVFQFFHLLEGMTALENIALAAAIAGAPVRAAERRGHDLLDLLGLADKAGDRERDSADEALRVFGHRLTRELPTDELLLQLAETLRRTLGLRAAEVWTGANGLLERTVADPARDEASVLLTAGEESVLGRAGVVGQAWLGVWLPQLADGREAAVLRVAPATNAGELLGLIIVERAPGAEDFRVEEERLLADLARQLALALRNVHLDSALQASLAELRLQAEELRASRARVVTAADAERRRIERDLHDGAQQQLVGLLVNLRLARELADSKPAEATALLESLRADAKEALEELQELAHGIYPPLLADRGLAEALRAVAARAGTPTRVEAAAAGRYPPDVEATVYFCCLEALQNAAKHAGPGARATLRVWEEQRTLRFEVADDGAGFEPGRRPRGAGLSNMGDRLGALGGHLSLSATPGRGTSVSGTVPLEP